MARMLMRGDTLMDYECNYGPTDSHAQSRLDKLEAMMKRAVVEIDGKKYRVTFEPEPVVHAPPARDPYDALVKTFLAKQPDARRIK